MTAVSVICVRSGTYSRATGVDSVALDRTPEPDIYAHRWRDGLRIRWSITAGPSGWGMEEGTALTRGGALVKATAAAHRPGILARARKGGVR